MSFNGFARRMCASCGDEVAPGSPWCMICGEAFQRLAATAKASMDHQRAEQERIVKAEQAERIWQAIVAASQT